MSLDFNADFFTLFGLPRGFRLDGALLDRQYREVQAQVHPDKFAQATESERRLSLQWATRVNEAYQTLKKPLLRAQYLLALADCPVDAQRNTAMPPQFLIEQMEWRESVADARQARAQDELEALHGRSRGEMLRGFDELATLLDERKDFVGAAEQVRRLMFMEKLQSEIDDALAALDP